MSNYSLKKVDLSAFLDKVRLNNQLIAPVKTDLVRFELVEDADKVYLDEQSFFPLKSFLFKHNDVLFKFDGKKIVVPERKSISKVFFGLRRCDLNAILHQDKALMDIDPGYKAERENNLLIGYHCFEAPTKYCFCGTLKLEDFYDLMFYDDGDNFIIETGSEKGLKMVEDHNEFFTKTDKKIKDKKIKNADRLFKEDISQFYDHPDWQKGVDKCISCAACTNLCPTCYCFDIKDEMDLKNPKKVSRKREWSSCQLKDFTRVAGNHVFRNSRKDRFKHRIYHQLDYFKKKNGINLCVGCGRCITGCPTKIDFVEILNEMK